MKSHHWTGEGTEGQRLPRPKKADIVAARRDLKQTRFLADESVEVAVAVLLRRQRFNVGHTSEAGMRGHPDENSFPYAAREDRVLLTRDTDFLDNHAFPPYLNPGLIVLPSPSTAARNSLPAISDWVARTIGRSRDLWRRAKIVFSGDGSYVVHTFEWDEGRIVTTRYRWRTDGHLEILAE